LDHNHPTPEELEGILLGGISAEQTRDVILHLLRGCEPCNLALLPYIPQPFLPKGRLAAPPPFQPEAYDAPIDRAFAALGLRVPPPDTAEESKREALDFLASAGLGSLADAPSHLSGRPLFEALLERSWSLRHDDPPQMVQLAHAATLLSSRLGGDGIGAREVADLRCRAFTEMANAYRVADELHLADHALGHATEHFLQGSQDELLLARFLDVYASQQAAVRHFELACGTLDMAIAIYRRHQDTHLAGRALIMKGIFAGYAGDAEEAIRIIRSGLLLIDERRDPGLAFSAMQSQTRFLVDCGQFRDALRALWSLRQRNLHMSGRVNALKLRWLEGQIHTGLKKFDLAERALRQVKEGFEEAGLGYKAALAGLELGAVWLQQGHLQEAESVVLECADAFIALRIQREHMASILVLRKAAETRYLNLKLLQHVIGLLHKEERIPNASPREEP
jgi:tetratricopeptide (TPR) repeat protein